jgi:diguanylate cyclase (GGDEF)-like protein/PAS domain S-box-containing protein
MKRNYTFDKIVIILAVIVVIVSTLFFIIGMGTHPFIIETFESQATVNISFDELTNDETDFVYYIKQPGDPFVYEYTADILLSDIEQINDDAVVLFTPYIQSEAFEIYINDTLVAVEGDKAHYNSNIWSNRFYYTLDKDIFSEEINTFKVVQYSRYMTGGIGNSFKIEGYDASMGLQNIYEIEFRGALTGICFGLLLLSIIIMLSLPVDRKTYGIIIAILLLMVGANSEMYIINYLGIDFMLYKKFVISAYLIVGGIGTALVFILLDIRKKIKIPVIIYILAIIAVAIFSPNMIVYKTIYDYLMMFLALQFMTWIILAIIRLKTSWMAYLILASGISFMLFVFTYVFNEIFRNGVVVSFNIIVVPIMLIIILTILLTDIYGEKQLKEMFAKKSEEFVSIFNNSQIGIVQTDKNGNIVKANMKIAEMLGYESPKMIVGNDSKLYHVSEDEYNEIMGRFYTKIINHIPVEGDFQFFKKDKTTIWLTISGGAIDMNTPADLSKGIIWSLSDISERKESEKKLLELSRTDSLTGVNNRRYFLELGNNLYEFHERYKKPLSVLMIDIDFFKNVNDKFGHEIGDKAIKYVTDLCVGIIRNHDVFGRIGGEEFTALLMETDSENAIVIAERIRKKICDSTPCGEIPALTVSVGVYTEKKYEPSATLEKAIKKADEKLYIAKEQGRNQVKA